MPLQSCRMICFASLPLSLSRKDSERLHGPVVRCFSAFQPLFALRWDPGRLHGPVASGLPVCCGDRVLLMEEKTFHQAQKTPKMLPMEANWFHREHSEALGGARRTSGECRNHSLSPVVLRFRHIADSGCSR